MWWNTSFWLVGFKISETLSRALSYLKINILLSVKTPQTLFEYLHSSLHLVFISSVSPLCLPALIQGGVKNNKINVHETSSNLCFTDLGRLNTAIKVLPNPPFSIKLSIVFKFMFSDRSGLFLKSSWQNSQMINYSKWT